MSTCILLDLETLGSWPIMPKNLLGEVDEFFFSFLENSFMTIYFKGSFAYLLIKIGFLLLAF